MLATTHCLRTRSNIKEIKKLDNNLIAIATQLHGIRMFSHQDCENRSTFSHEHLNSETASVSFSPNGEFVAFNQGSFIFIVHIPSKEVLKTIKADDEKIQKLQFDLESKYIIAATASGRVLQYRYDGSSLIGRLYSFEYKNTKASLVSAFAFYANIMACGGNDGTLFTINLHSRANKLEIKNDASRITSICFLDANTLLSANTKGCLHLNSAKTGKLIKKVESGFVKITQIFLMPNPKYFMLIGGTKDVAVYDSQTLKLLHNKYIEFEEPVTRLEIADDNTILAILKHQSIEKVLLPTAEKLKSFLVSGEFNKAYELVKKDPLLLGTKEYKVLEIAYNKLYKQAQNALIKGDKQTAVKLTQMFKYIDAKREDIAMLFNAFENYTRFKTLYIEKKYALCFAMAAKFPPLKDTFQYSKLEELWDDTIKNAQRQIEHGHDENAVTLLKEFATITEKRPFIKLILHHNAELVKFLQAIELKDYTTIDTFVQSNPVFTLIPQYKNIEEEMHLQLAHVQKHIDKCDLKTAVTKLSKLQNIDSIQEQVNEQKEECRAVKKLQDAYKINNFIQCYEIIDTNASLNSTELGKMLQKHWLELISRCEESALKGNIPKIKEELGELIQLQTRRDKIGDLFRLAFHTKIKALVAKKLYKNSEAIIYSYIDIFGLDNEIKAIMKTYEHRSKEKLAITQDSGNRTSRDKWIDSQEIMGDIAS